MSDVTSVGYKNKGVMRLSVVYGVCHMLLLACLLLSCSQQARISRLANRSMLGTAPFKQAHTGVAIMNIADGRYLYRLNSERYFVPASNVKIPTLYAAMKFLPAMLPGLLVAETMDTVYVQPTGDPSLLHPDFKKHPVYDYLRQMHKPVVLNASNWKAEALGYGWAWDDYMAYYMAERSPLPVYGNIVRWIQQRSVETRDGVTDTAVLMLSDPEINWEVHLSEKRARQFSVTRNRTENRYEITEGKEWKKELEVPFVTNGVGAAMELLADTLKRNLLLRNDAILPQAETAGTLYSQPTDSVLRHMMHRSDNFFAEQLLLMVSNGMLGVMDEQRLIDTLLRSALSGFPQPPVWVDGSGLSRYNLFSPEDFTWLLHKMKQEFGMQRLQHLFPTGNQGTLRNYYKDLSGAVFAKTGTLSGQVALSGFLQTRRNKLLAFSVLVNNHHSNVTEVRRGVERFLTTLYNKY